MVSIERIQEVVKDELRLKLRAYEKYDFYCTINDTVYVRGNSHNKTWYISLNKLTKKYNIALTSYTLDSEKELRELIKKFKKVRKMIWNIEKKQSWLRRLSMKAI